jgi:hypothetical protein
VTATRVVLVVLVLAGAAFLRFWRLSWALTDGTWFPRRGAVGELREPVLAAHLALFVADFHLTRPYPAGYAIVTGVPLAIVRSLGIVPFADGKADAILVARAVSATAGVASVVLVGLYARRVGGAVAGIAAAALMAVVPLHAMQNHYASTDVLHTMCVVLVMFAGHALVTRGTRTSAACSGRRRGSRSGRSTRASPCSRRAACSCSTSRSGGARSRSPSTWGSGSSPGSSSRSRSRARRARSIRSASST